MCLAAAVQVRGQRRRVPVVRVSLTDRHCTYQVYNMTLSEAMGPKLYKLVTSSLPTQYQAGRCCKLYAVSGGHLTQARTYLPFIASGAHLLLDEVGLVFADCLPNLVHIVVAQWRTCAEYSKRSLWAGVCERATWAGYRATPSEHIAGLRCWRTADGEG